MANPFDAYLNAALKQKFDQAIQALLKFGKRPCQLFLATSKTIPCTACSAEVTSSSPNKYIGPKNVGCSICGGTKKIQQKVTRDINLVVIFDSSKFIDVGGNVKFATDMAQTVSLASETHSDILKCEYIMFDTDIETFKNDQYMRFGRPQTLGLGDNAYIIINWKKVS